jgi:cytochrome c
MVARNTFGVLAVSMLLVVSFFSSANAESTSSRDRYFKGRDLYEAKCGGCHSVDQNRVGPLHRGLNNRLIGSVLGFEYSSALTAAGSEKSQRWNAISLDKWLIDPEAFLPGQSMNYSANDPLERKLIIDYLLSLQH